MDEWMTEHASNQPPNESSDMPQDVAIRGIKPMDQSRMDLTRQQVSKQGVEERLNGDFCGDV